MKAFDRFLQRWRISMVSACIPQGASVLDIGSADGSLAANVPQLGRYVGIDPDVVNPGTVGKVTMLTGYFPQALPTPEKFDVITLLAVLEHIPPDIQKTLAQDIANHLHPGGRLLITAPSPAVDYILAVLKFTRVIDGMSLEQHYGFNPKQTPSVFTAPAFELERHARFQLGLNHFFSFKRTNTA